MKTLNTNCYEGLYGLSCLENTILMNLKECGYDTAWLYADSEISLKDLIQCFFYENQKYIYFDGFPKIHSKLEKLGIISVDMKNTTAEKYFEMLETDKDALYFISTKPELFKSICKTIPWRDDYYTYTKLLKNDNFITLKYDEPFFETNMKRHEVGEIFTGQLVKVRKLREINKDDERLFKRQYHRAEVPEDWKDLIIPGLEYMSEVFIKLRDLIGVYMISRKRRQIYESTFKNTGYMDTGLYEIDKLFTFVLEMSLKNTAAHRDDVFQIVKSLWEAEQKIS